MITKPSWCRLCEGLLRFEAFRYHKAHGEDNCKWAEEGRIEEELLNERFALEDEEDKND